MHVKAFPLERKGLKRLLLTWETGQRDVRLYLDGQILSLSDYREAILPDGATVITINFNWFGQPNARANGRPLPGSVNDSVRRIPVAAGTCLVDATLWILGALGDMIDGSSSSNQPNSVTFTAYGTTLLDKLLPDIYVLAGLVLIACGVFIALRTRLALWIALAIYGIDTALTIIGALLVSHNWIGVAFHVGSMYLMARAFAGFDLLQAEEAEALMPHQPTQVPSLAINQPVFQPPPAKPLIITSVSSLNTDVPVLEQVETYLRTGDMAQAKAILKDFMRENPTNAYGWYLVSFILPNPDEQSTALIRALRYNPGLSKAQTRLTAIQYEAQFKSDARPTQEP